MEEYEYYMTFNPLETGDTSMVEDSNNLHTSISIYCTKYFFKISSKCFRIYRFMFSSLTKDPTEVQTTGIQRVKKMGKNA